MSLNRAESSSVQVNSQIMTKILFALELLHIQRRWEDFECANYISIFWINRSTSALHFSRDGWVKRFGMSHQTMVKNSEFRQHWLCWLIIVINPRLKNTWLVKVRVGFFNEICVTYQGGPPVAWVCGPPIDVNHHRDRHMLRKREKILFDPLSSRKEEKLMSVFANSTLKARAPFFIHSGFFPRFFVKRSLMNASKHHTFNAGVAKVIFSRGQLMIGHQKWSIILP